MDPLSDVLSLLKPASYQFGGFEAGGDWAVSFPAADGVKCYSLVSGECWLAVESVSDPVRVRAGDCCLLPRGLPFLLAGDLNAPPIDAYALFGATRPGGITRCNGGGDVIGVGGHFNFFGRHAAAFLAMLPPIVHIRNEADKAAIRWSMERLMDELRSPRPGSYLLAQHTAHMMLIQALRIHIAEETGARVGWLFALADAQIGAAITRMHEAPGERFTLQALAEHVGLSRSTFALKFKALVGCSPMEYLTRWRMMLAEDLLCTTRESISAISTQLGYESESAFSTAFKRVVGCSPRQFSAGRLGKIPEPGQ